MPRFKECPPDAPRSLRALPRLTHAVAAWAASRPEVYGYGVGVDPLPPNGRAALKVSAAFVHAGRKCGIEARFDPLAEREQGDPSRLVSKVLTRKLLDAKAEVEREARKEADLAGQRRD